MKVYIKVSPLKYWENLNSVVRLVVPLLQFRLEVFDMPGRGLISRSGSNLERDWVLSYNPEL